MGKLLEILQGISLPPDVESQIRVYDLQIEKLEQDNVTLRIENEDSQRSLEQLESQLTSKSYTTQRIVHPDEPTEPERQLLIIISNSDTGSLQDYKIQNAAALSTTKFNFHMTRLHDNGYTLGHVYVSLTQKARTYLIENDLIE